MEAKETTDIMIMIAKILVNFFSFFGSSKVLDLSLIEVSTIIVGIKNTKL